MLRIEKSAFQKRFWIMSDIDNVEVCVDLEKINSGIGECFSHREISDNSLAFEEATPEELYDALMETGMMEELFKYLESITGK